MKENSKIGYANLTKYFSMRTRQEHIAFSGAFELTPRCNMNCKMCYIRMNEEEMKQVGEELPVEEWIRIAKEAVEQGMVMLLLTGGEAILYKDFKKLYLELRKLGLFISINTNATMLDDDWISFFKENPPAKFNITIYGGSNETYARLCNNPKGFDQLKVAVEKLQKNHFQILLNCVITKQNVEDMENIFAFGEEHNLKVHATTYAFPPVRKEGVDSPELNRFQPKEAAKARVRMEWNSLGGNDGLRKRAEFLKKHLEDAEPLEDICGEIKGEKVLCAAGRSTFWVTWDGRVLPCGMIPDYSIPIQNRKFINVWQEIVTHTEQITLAPECKICKKKKFCMPCAAKIKSETGTYGQKSEYMCEYVDEYLRLLETSLMEK